MPPGIVAVRKLFKRAAPQIPDSFLAGLRASLEATQSVVDASGMPFLSGALQVAVEILNVIQQIRANKARCLQLAQRIVTLMTAIYKAVSMDPLTVEIVKEQNSPLVSAISDLKDIMLRIHTAVNALARQNVRRRFWHKAQAKEDLDQYESELALAYDAFKLELSVSTAAIVRSISDDVKSANVDETEGYELKWPEINLRYPTLAASNDGTFWANTDHADVRGQLVIVKRHKDKDSHKFLKDVEWFTKYRHANLPQMLGISRKTAKLPFIAFKMRSLVPATQYIDSLDSYGMSKTLLLGWSMWFELHSVQRYFKAEGFVLDQKSLFASTVVDEQTGQTITAPPEDYLQPNQPPSPASHESSTVNPPVYHMSLLPAFVTNHLPTSQRPSSASHELPTVNLPHLLMSRIPAFVATLNSRNKYEDILQALYVGGDIGGEHLFYGNTHLYVGIANGHGTLCLPSEEISGVSMTATDAFASKARLRADDPDTPLHTLDNEQIATDMWRCTVHHEDGSDITLQYNMLLIASMEKEGSPLSPRVVLKTQVPRRNGNDSSTLYLYTRFCRDHSTVQSLWSRSQDLGTETQSKHWSAKHNSFRTIPLMTLERPVLINAKDRIPDHIRAKSEWLRNAEALGSGIRSLDTDDS